MHLFLLSVLCLTLFASNTLLCRYALQQGTGPLCYTALRALAAVLMLMLIITVKKGGSWRAKLARSGSSWQGAVFLYGYMLCFSLGFLGISSAAGTLLLNSSVQISMLGVGLLAGLTLSKREVAGYLIAFLGLLLLCSNAFAVPSLGHAFLMCVAGLCWGGYTLAGKESREPTLATAGHFLRTLPFILITLGVSFLCQEEVSLSGVLAALGAGALASALGYVLWYFLLPHFSLLVSACMQLIVPVLTALLAFVVLHEPVSWHLFFCAVLILGGIAATAFEKGAQKDHSQKR